MIVHPSGAWFESDEKTLAAQDPVENGALAAVAGAVNRAAAIGLVGRLRVEVCRQADEGGSTTGYRATAVPDLDLGDATTNGPR